MRMIVKYNYIDYKITSIKKLLTELSNAKDKLKSDILLLEKCYRGEDGELTKNIYLSNLTLIETYIQNINNYMEYFDWLMSSYKENQQVTKSNLLNGLDSISNNNVYDDNYSFYDWSDRVDE